MRLACVHAQITAAAFASAGLRGEDRMEDRHLLACPLPGSELGLGSGSGAGPASPSEELGGSACLLGVFDGHRGASAAEFAAEQLLEHLRVAWGAPSAEAALKRAFVGLDTAFREAQVGMRVPTGCLHQSCRARGGGMVECLLTGWASICCISLSCSTLSARYTASKCRRACHARLSRV